MLSYSRAAIFLGLAASVTAFAPSRQLPVAMNTQQSQLSMGFLDDFKNVFGSEGREERKRMEEQKKAEQEEAQRLMMERRRNPDKMDEYDDMVNKRRRMYKEMKTDLEKIQETVYVDEKNKE
jgi:esterase/lipase